MAFVVNDPAIQQQLATKGVVGAYFLGGKIAWAKKNCKTQSCEESSVNE